MSHPVELGDPGGGALVRAIALLQAGEPVGWRGLTLRLHGADFDVRVPAPADPAAVTSRRALDLLTRARYRLGALLASAPPLDAAVGNRLPRLVLVRPDAAELWELRGDRLRRLE